MAAVPQAHVHIESMQTAVPARVAVERGRSLPIFVPGQPLTAAELQRRFRAVLYFRGADGGQLEGTARARLEQAMWVKESLTEALADHPKMAGRLRRRAACDGPWEVRLSDSGVRLLLASADTTMSAFMEAKDREPKEAALALWTDVDVQEPEMCAPFIMQLTRFEDGGFAIGVCCSLLHADPLSLINFLKSWARTNAQLQAQSKLVLSPLIHYTRCFQSPGAAKRLRSTPLDSTSSSVAGATTTVLFRATHDDAPAPDRHALAAACVGQASEKLGVKKPPRFVVFAGDAASGGLNVDTCSTRCDGKAAPYHGHALRAASWQEAGLEEVVLEGSKPVHVSYTVVSPCADEGIVVVMPVGNARSLDQRNCSQLLVRGSRDSITAVQDIGGSVRPVAKLRVQMYDFINFDNQIK